jgi:hypothetical protein
LDYIGRGEIFLYFWKTKEPDSSCMTNNHGKLVYQILPLVCLLTGIPYIFFVIQPELYFHHVQSPLIMSMEFISRYFNYPGGLAELTGNFLMQGFLIKYFGTLIFFSVVLLIWCATYVLLNDINRNNLNGIFALIPFMSAVLSANNYNFPFSVVISIFFLLILLLPLTGRGSRPVKLLLLYLAGAGLIFWISGSGYFVIFSVAAIIMISGKKGRGWFFTAAFIALFAGLIPIAVSNYIYPLPPESIYFHFFPSRFYFMTYQASPVFFSFLLSVPLLMVLNHIIYGYKKIKGGLAQPNNLQQLAVYVIFAGILLSGYFGYRLSYQSDEKKIVACDYYCYMDNPKEVAKASTSLLNYNFAANVNYNLSISKAGRLTEDFFNFLQISGSISLYPDYEFSPEMSFVAADLYYHLGYITEARHWAYEALVFYPYSPRVMQGLVKIHLVMGEYKAAERYLNLLDRGFNSGKFVNKYRTFINDTSLIAGDKEIMEKRCSIPEGKELTPYIRQRFEELMEANSGNKRAFEWLMLYHLLEGELEKFFELYVQSGLNSPLPVYEEAVLLYGEKYGLPVTEEYNISINSLERFNGFKQELMKYNGNNRAALNGMYRKFGNSYLYYLQFLYPRIIKPDYIHEYDESQSI